MAKKEPLPHKVLAGQPGSGSLIQFRHVCLTSLLEGLLLW